MSAKVTSNLKRKSIKKTPAKIGEKKLTGERHKDFEGFYFSNQDNLVLNPPIESAVGEGVCTKKLRTTLESAKSEKKKLNGQVTYGKDKVDKGQTTKWNAGGVNEVAPNCEVAHKYTMEGKQEWLEDNLFFSIVKSNQESESNVETSNNNGAQAQIKLLLDTIKLRQKMRQNSNVDGKAPAYSLSAYLMEEN